MSNPWIKEAWRLAFILIIAIAIGLMADAIAVTLLIFITAYLVYHLRNIYRLERWYRQPKKAQPPTATGIWDEIFNHVYRRQQRDRQRKKRLATIVSRFNESTAAMPDATVVLNRQGNIEWINKAATEMLGLSSKVDVGQRIDNLIRAPRFVDFINADEFDQPLEMASPLNNGKYLSVRVVNYGKRQRLMIVRDISRLKHLERVRQDFVANVSHELRTPLTVINGYLENIIDSNGACTDRWGKALDQMQTQSRRMTRIVEDLLHLSRLDANDTPDNMGAVAIPNIIMSLKEQAEVLSGDNHHKLLTELEKNLWLQGNEKIIHSICSNLIFNAVQYTPAGGEIRIRWYHDENNVYFEVKDSGIGIASHHIPRLTERFYRVDPGRSRAAGGTGLGLAIVSHGLQRHGGRLEITSKIGEGSTFRAIFPRKLAILRD